MDKELTCNQVSALMKFYVQGKLNAKLTQYVHTHLLRCKKCREKVDMISFGHKIKDDKKNNVLPLNIDLKNSLSAYIDNELNNSDTIKIKKKAISNLSTRKELETMYKFKQLLKSAYEKTKDSSKFDCSKNIMYMLQTGEDYSTCYFKKLAILFTALICCIVAGFIYLYF